MELLDYPIEMRAGDRLYLHCFSDIHREALGCDAKALRSDISKLRVACERGEIHRWIGGGDWLNCVNPKDKRFDAAAVHPEFRDFIGDDLMGAVTAKLVGEFDPIKQYCIGVGAGNHELAAAKYNEYNAAKDIARRLDVPYLGYSTLIRIRMKDEHRTVNLFVYWHHGTGASATTAGKVKAALKLQDVVKADIYFSGHTHEQFEVPRVRLEGASRGALRLIARPQLFINAGTYLKTYLSDTVAQKAGAFNENAVPRPDYSEVKMYQPSVIGHGACWVRAVLPNHGGRRRKASNWGIEIGRVDCL